MDNGVFSQLLAAVGDVMVAHGPAVARTASLAPADYSVHFFLQIAVILLSCRTIGWLGQRLFRQPQVVGEMIAGVMLGPSLLGQLSPGLQAMLFPPETKAVLYVSAQFGIGLYMFLVGTRLRTDHFRANARSAMVVSTAGIAAPFLAAVLITPFLLSVPGLFSPRLSQAEASLFLGACIGLTAFPVLARIINERGLADTRLGTLSLTAGAFDDVCAWVLLAIVLATLGAGPGVAILAIGGGAVHAAFLLLAGRRLLAPLGRAVEARGEMSPLILAVTLALFSLSAFLTDAAGLHAVFGGFLLGVVMPRGLFAEELRRKLETVTEVMLVPLFFTYSGLNTSIDMMTSAPLLLIALGILAVSILTKLGACWAAARFNGEDNATAFGIGALMNARGLMELIIINIGLQKGIIGPTLFSMLALMAIATTMMAGPLFDLIHRKRGAPSPLPAPVPDSAEPA